MRINTISKIGIFVAASLALGGCKDFMDPSTGTILLETENYKRSVQVKANFIGVAASFKNVAEHWLILAELRGDLITPTYNAPTEFWDVYNYKVDSENYIVDPSAYYRMIINCNDFIRHAVAYDIKYPGVIAADIAKGMIAEALRYRAWCYLTLGKLYGEAIYYDLALVDDVDILNEPEHWPSPMDSIYFDGRPGYVAVDHITGEEIFHPRPEGSAIRMSLSRLVEELVDHLNTGVKGYDGLATFNWLDLTNDTDASWNRLGINPNALIGELYMWQAAFNPSQEFALYQTALRYLIQIPRNSVDANTFTLATNSAASAWSSATYKNLFVYGTNHNITEILTMIPYNVVHQQTSKMSSYFASTTTDGGLYYMKPTNVIANMYDNTPTASGYGDTRRKEAFMTSDNVIKYDSPLNHGSTIIYRAGEIHLMIAECLNHVGLHEEALTFFGEGMSKHWSDGFFKYPYSNPLFGNNLRFSPGVRGRANLVQYQFRNRRARPSDVVNRYTFDSLGTSPLDLDRKRFIIDSLIANEVALECAFEGKRYFTLLRQAIMWDRPDYLMNTLSAKYDDPTAMKATLSDRKNWFIPYNQTGLY